MTMNMLSKIVTGALIAFIAGIIVFVIVSILGALPLMLLWNWLMPVIFGLTKITFWQSFGLLFLCSILFKNTSISSESK